MGAVGMDGVAEQIRTFTYTDPVSGSSVECDRCPPGTYLRARCTSTAKSVCVPCPSGSFTELWNSIAKCLRCGVCGHYEVVRTACSADSDLQCECNQGYYYKKSSGMCHRHRQCPSGQEVLTKGGADEDTTCHSCPIGTYSDTASAHQNCTQHKRCDAPELQLVLKGSTWHDSVCKKREELESRDGGDYLKEILPAFFVHQKMCIRRLRQIVHKLRSEDGKKQRSSGLNLSALHVQINTWVASATANQIRQLPAILTKTGANSAGERLLNKLKKIDSNLSQISLDALGTKVDVIVMSE
ncbi:tumor necrosis factor receptor superfamily member 6B-like isoform X2 [Cottoperca gobio]|nr:tumor necrosis factor receptor superfamily member 6B-like isoform X2 [Cottoperca gobio]XP_029299268.1 tumor necrosis factor receptor superfamily member 6B-like isoform X2 [Cottoperca gobio]XP_029299270.1 tumor necrosis factor receptor superfamily member 6B-like isoform X2 [Cottoperca gobio]